MGDFAPMTFYVGHHDSQRTVAVTEEVFHHAEDLGYDTLSTPITNAHFHPRVLFQLSEHMRNCEAALASSLPPPPAPTLAALTADDSDLSPSDLAPRLLHIASPWIDLASPDPVIADISRQVLQLEASYAAFCGATNVLVEGPAAAISDAGLAQFSRAVSKALELAPGIHFQVLMPMSYESNPQQMGDFAHLGRFARDEYVTNAIERSTKDHLSSWDAWHHIRSFSKYDIRLSLALSIPLQLPSPKCQDRWHSEPIRILCLSRSTFTPNKFSVDVLAKPHQALISRYLRLKTMPWFLVTDIGPLPESDESGGEFQAQAGAQSNGTPPPAGGLSPLAMNPTPAEMMRKQKGYAVHPSQKPLAHLEYLRQHLQSRQPALSPLEQYGAGYQDFPQSPLQPLTDNLESVTYEVFEKDPVKYEWYERAIAAALTDWRRLDKPRSWNTKVVIAVVGAGRGPLVQRALVAAEKAHVDVDVWAVEKNPSAFVHLHRRKRDEWGDKVHLCQSDMRGWKGPLYPPPQPTAGGTSAAEAKDLTSTTVDILISELLGSFADNELSPECLDGVQHLLSPEHGISIPQNYTAHLTPIAAPRLWYDISCRGKLLSGVEATSIPYVAWLHAIDYLATELKPPAETNNFLTTAGPDGAPAGKQPDRVPWPIVKQAWSFSHPLPQSSIHPSNTHNTRFSYLSFPTPHRGVLHGVGGYFETVLYASPDSSNSSSTMPIELSTHPLTMPSKSPDMISWFPIFFPIKEPIEVVEGGEVGVSMWRQTDGRKVWYEWFVEVFATVAGRKVAIGRSALTSSEREGCMM